MINESGATIGDRYSYDAWGQQTSHTGTTANPWGYASGYLDTTGLIKFGTRYYDPNLGRWAQLDPVGGEIDNPHTLNRFHYAADNPVNLTDASGCQIQPPIPVFQRRIGICADANLRCLQCCATKSNVNQCKACCTGCYGGCVIERPCPRGACFGWYPGIRI
jgi:RHS repeat-associated protein